MEKLCILVCCSLILFAFDAKSGTTNNHCNGFSDIQYCCPSSRDSNETELFPKILPVEIFDFPSNFDRVKRSNNDRII